jgi:hypothetical protein
MTCDFKQRFVLVDQASKDGRRRICRALALGWAITRGGAPLQRSVRTLRVVVRGLCREDAVHVLLSEDHHPVGEFGVNGQHEAFTKAVRSRTSWWDLDHRDTRIRKHCVERGRELSSPIADEEPEPRGVVAEIHHDVAGLPKRCGARWY